MASLDRRLPLPLAVGCEGWSGGESSTSIGWVVQVCCWLTGSACLVGDACCRMPRLAGGSGPGAVEECTCCAERVLGPATGGSAGNGGDCEWAGVTEGGWGRATAFRLWTTGLGSGESSGKRNGSGFLGEAFAEGCVAHKVMNADWSVLWDL